MIYASAVRRIIQASSGIVYVGGKIVVDPSTFDTTGLTGGIGTQAEAGDFILTYRCSTVLQSAFSGFTQILGRSHTSTTRKTYLTVDYRVAEAAGESLSCDSTRLVMMVFRGVGSVESSAGATATGGILTPPPITPVTLGAIVVAGGASNNLAIMNSPPAGALYSVVHAPSDGMDIGMCVGTTAEWNIAGSQTGTSKCMASIVLAPA